MNDGFTNLNYYFINSTLTERFALLDNKLQIQSF